jgi:hypothetical protein
MFIMNTSRKGCPGRKACEIRPRWGVLANQAAGRGVTGGREGDYDPPIAEA